MQCPHDIVHVLAIYRYLSIPTISWELRWEGEKITAVPFAWAMDLGVDPLLSGHIELPPIILEQLTLKCARNLELILKICEWLGLPN